MLIENGDLAGRYAGELSAALGLTDAFVMRFVKTAPLSFADANPSCRRRRGVRIWPARVGKGVSITERIPGSSGGPLLKPTTRAILTRFEEAPCFVRRIIVLQHLRS